MLPHKVTNNTFQAIKDIQEIDMPNLHLILKSILLIAGLLIPKISVAMHLGMIPTIDTNEARLFLEGRTDLWTAPYQDKKTPLRVHEIIIKAPILKSEFWTASAHINIEGLSSGRADLSVGNNPVFIGSDLRTQSAGLGVKKVALDSSTFSVFAAYNSSSDEPYKNTRDTWTEITMFYELAAKGNLQWIIAANSSKNRGFLNDQIVPFVGVNYKPNSEFAATIGFPFARFIWSPEGFWTSVLYFTPVGAHGEVTLASSPSMSWHIKSGLSSRSYLHVNRTEDSMRLIFEEKYLDIGLKLKVSERTVVGYKIGTSFDRAFYDAKSVFAAEGQKTALNSDLYGAIQLEITL